MRWTQPGWSILHAPPCSAFPFSNCLNSLPPFFFYNSLFPIFLFPPSLCVFFFPLLESSLLPTGPFTICHEWVGDLKLARIICTRYLLLKQLRPSQIDREQLIKEVEINRHQCGASHTQWQTRGKGINLWVCLQDERTAKTICRRIKQPRLWWETQKPLSESSWRTPSVLWFSLFVHLSHI